MFKRLFFDLANPLAADFKPGADFLQRLRRFRQHPVTDDVSFPFGQPAQTFLQHPVFLRRVLLVLCILAVLWLGYSCMMPQLLFSARGTMIFMPDPPLRG